MRKRQFNDLRDLRHGLVNRRNPRQRRNRQPLPAQSQAAQQRLSHDRVTNPLRGNDQRLPPHATLSRQKGTRHASAQRRNAHPL